MKRLTTVGLAVFCAMALAVQAAEVPSVNTVGYVKRSVVQGFNQFAFNWEAVGGAQAVSVQDLVSKDGLTAQIDPSLADNIWIWNPNLNGPGNGGYVRMFLFESGGIIAAWDGKWVYNDLSGPATDMIARGDAFWLSHVGASVDLVVSGQVPDSDDSYQVTFAPGFTLFGSGYSADLTINGVAWANSNGQIDPSLSDNIWVWDANLNGPGNGGYVRMFYFQSGGIIVAWDGKWVYNDLSGPSTEVMTLGQGAWYVNSGLADVVWTQPKPYSL
jgi:hypothetical protein